LVIVFLLTGCAAFGAADQYLGSLTRFWAHAWEVPALSAPWLVLPFLLGRTQRSAPAAAVVGGVGTLLALVAYGLMTISPLEQAQFTLPSFIAFARSNTLWFAGSAVTGPAFGYLGHRWGIAQDRLAAALLTGAVLLEPLAHGVPHQPLPLSQIPFGVVTVTELLVGAAMGIWFGIRRSTVTASTTS
jgi:hypothetical protein